MIIFLVYTLSGNKHQDQWKKILRKTPLYIIKEIAMAVCKITSIHPGQSVLGCRICKARLKIEALEKHYSIFHQGKAFQRFHHVENNTPLHVGAWIGNLGVCQYLLNNTIDNNPRNKDGETPLHMGKSNV